MRTYPKADAVIGVSKGFTDDLEQVASLPPGLARTVYNPVITRDLLADADIVPDDPWLAEYGPPLMLSAGRLVAKKDCATLLRGFARLRQNRPARLIILGKGPHQGRLERLARELEIQEDIRFTSWVDNVYRLYGQGLGVRSDVDAGRIAGCVDPGSCMRLPGCLDRLPKRPRRNPGGRQDRPLDSDRQR